MTREEAIKYGIEWLKDEYLDAKDGAFIKIALEALEQEPCEDAISRQAVLDKKKLVELEDGQSFYCISPEDVETLPPVTPQPKYEDIAKAFQLGISFGFIDGLANKTQESEGEG